MSSSDIITKRLHISGLTSSLTASDLTKRLSTFGNVLSADGFGLTDALGDPRRFGYITIETTKGQLAKCLNFLSGSTWKGTKLRIGEARLDYRERLAKEREAIYDPPHKKQRISKYGAVAAPDLHQLVTPESAAHKPGWKVTPGGRVIRPIRMRPDHPLPPPLYTDSNSKTKKNGVTEKKGKRQKPPPTRARRRTIDPTNWDSTQLKGIFLDVEPSTLIVHGPTTDGFLRIDPTEALPSTSDKNSESDEEAEEVIPPLPSPKKGPSQPPATKPTPIVEPNLPQNLPSASTVTVDDPSSSSNLRAEKAQALNLLQGLFGDAADWIGREELDSDVDEQDLVRAEKEKNRPAATHDVGDYEVVPMDADCIHDEDQEADGKHQEPEEGMNVDNDKNDASQRQEPEIISEKANSAPQDDAQKGKLKDLFAPREEEAGFSLLGHLDLDLDLELEDDPLLSGPSHSGAQAIPTLVVPVVAHDYIVPLPTSAKSFDPSRPLFFPSSRPGARDLFAVARERGWKSSDFRRTETEDEIRKRWEDNKLELTRDWKKRAREAAKLRRRRGGGAGVDDMK